MSKRVLSWLTVLVILAGMLAGCVAPAAAPTPAPAAQAPEPTAVPPTRGARAHQGAGTYGGPADRSARTDQSPGAYPGDGGP